MKIVQLIAAVVLTGTLAVNAQQPRLEIKSAKYRTTDKITIEGEVGYYTVPENRHVNNSRNIKIRFIRLKSLSKNPKHPVIYLEGGGSASTWQAESPRDLNDWLPVLRVSDLIFVDQRGTADKDMVFVWNGDYPEDFLVSEKAAGLHYQDMCGKALEHFQQKGIDVSGYNIEMHARDIHDLATALQIDKYALFGFSFGSHIGMAMIKLFPDHIANAILVGADGLDQSFNFPAHLDDHFGKIASMVAADPGIRVAIPDLTGLLKKVMTSLVANPVSVKVKHPLTGKAMDVKVGPFGLALIVRLEIDDTNDIPAIPRLLYTIDQGDYSMLEWFVQKRMAFAYAVPGNGINQAIASGATDERMQEIQTQCSTSVFGNVVNFPFYDAKKVWPMNVVSIDTTTPLVTSVRTLFVTGSLDCRTPVQQVNEIRKGFDNSIHIIVENAGHEQAMWDTEIFDEAIPQFLSGEDVKPGPAFYKEIKFIPLTGKQKGHASLR